MKETGQQNEKATVLDEAGALMEEEADWLESIATELSEKSGWNISVITYKDTLSYNDEYKNGLYCAVDTENKSVFLDASGEASEYLDSKRTEAILEEAKKPIKEQDYTQSLYLMLLGADKAYDSGKITHWQQSPLLFATAAFCILCVGIWWWRKKKK